MLSAPGEVAERLMAALLKSADSKEFVGSNPTLSATPRGLCGSCRYAREVTSGRGSVFVLCERSRDDASFPRYPRLPVLECRGYEPVEAGGSSAHSSTS